MRELISREVAEKLMRETNPLQSELEQNDEEIRIKIFLSNGQILFVNYQPKIQFKRYFRQSDQT